MAPRIDGPGAQSLWERLPDWLQRQIHILTTETEEDHFQLYFGDEAYEGAFQIEWDPQTYVLHVRVETDDEDRYDLEEMKDGVLSLGWGYASDYY